LIAISQNPDRGLISVLEEMRVPYYNIITQFLFQRNCVEKEGVKLRWVGNPPTRTLAGLLYEDCREYASSAKTKKGAKLEMVELRSKPAKTVIYAEKRTETTVVIPQNGNLQKALALMEKAIIAGVKDPVAFVESCLKDPRI